MKPIILILLLFLSSLGLPALAQEQQVIVPYTLADRDRTIRIEARMETLEAKMGALETKMDVKFVALETKMDVKFEAVNSRIESLIWIVGILVAMILFMFGYMIWDRRTALQPALNRATQADEKSTNLTRSLREYSKSHPDLAEILKSHGIL